MNDGDGASAVGTEHRSAAPSSTPMDDRTRAVTRFILAIVAVAVGLFVVTAVAADRLVPPNPARAAVLAVLFVAGGAVAGCFPLHLTNKTKVYADTAIHMAAALVFEPPLAMLVAGLGMGLAQAFRFDSWEETAFNTAQTAFFVGAGSGLFHALAGEPLSPVPSLATIGAMLACAVVMHLLNTLTVAVIAAKQEGLAPLRFWLGGLTPDLPESVAQFLFGVLIAVVAVDYLWMLPVFVLPIAVVYVSLRRNLEIRTATVAAVESLADVVDLRQPDKAGHSQRVAASTRRLAEQLGLSNAERERIVAAARVHDVGKVDLNPAIALRSGDPTLPATGEERLHPAAGARLISQFPSYVQAARDVLHHHECWDGSGYPDGLSGEAIPLGARLISVAEAYDSMTSPRRTRPALDPEAALRELERGAGRQWDPRVVQAMIAVVREDLVGTEPAPQRPLETFQTAPG